MCCISIEKIYFSFHENESRRSSVLTDLQIQNKDKKEVAATGAGYHLYGKFSLTSAAASLL